MTVVEITSEKEIEKCFDFFKKMWKELFDVDLKRERVVKKLLEKSIVYWIYKDEKIISAVQFVKCLKWETLTSWYVVNTNAYILWRIWTLHKFRKKWYWSSLITHWLKEIEKLWIKDFYIPSELSNIEYYQKFWFTEFWKEQILWNTKYIYMKNT